MMKPSSAQLALPPVPLQAECRSEISAKQPRWLTDAVATVVHAQRGTVKAIAAALGVPDRAVYDAADINNPKPLKAWWLPALCRETGTFTVVDVIEAQLGRVAFMLPSLPTHQDEMTCELARDVRLFGDFLQETGAALADGVVEPHEVAQVTKSIDQIIAGLCEYRELVVAKGRLDQAVAS